MNKYMLVLLLAAPGAVYAMEEGDTPAGVGSPGPNTNSQPGGSILAQVTNGSFNRGDDVSAAEQAFLDKFGGAFAKDIEEVKGEVRTLKSSLDELQGAFAALQKEEGNNNGVAGEAQDPEWEKISKEMAIVKHMATIMQLQLKEKDEHGISAWHGTVAYKTKSEREQILEKYLSNVTEYAKKQSNITKYQKRG